MKVDYTILYHGNCVDGFTSAWVARNALETSGYSCNYIACFHGTPLPDLPDLDTFVYVLDFSYPRDVLECLNKSHRGIQIIDHHESSQKFLSSLPYATTDTAHSGAVLTWKHFFGDDAMPQLIQYVEDKDLWRFNLEFSKKINAYIGSCSMDFSTWDFLADYLEKDTYAVAKEGDVVLRRKNTQVAKIVDGAYFTTVHNHSNIPVVNTSAYLSEVCDRLLDNNPSVPFAACFWDDLHGRRHWSLRSRGFDVSAIASCYGGGGHRCAAAFYVDKES